MSPPPLPTKDEFRLFVCSRGNDIISDGAYKKHIIACKENGDAWAERAQQGILAVLVYSEYVRKSAMRVSELPTKELDTVIREALATSSPPCKVYRGVGTCRITGLTSRSCIDLMRSSSPLPHQSDSSLKMLVHPRLSHFFYMLWYACKIEHVVRNSARDWLRSQSGTMLELCKKFESREDVISAMYTAYVKACAHVVRSIDDHMKHSLEQQCLPPPAKKAKRQS
jgi:hypothetical protein